MMTKKLVYTQVTPIPSYIPRQLAIDLLHSHGEIINLNPLVLGFEPIKAPRDAPADEFYSTWYEIEERIQFLPGAGRYGSSKIKFKGCFHDLPWGLQTHIYAPANVDLRNKWRIAGNQPGEPREPPEMGIGAPPDGLYLREDVEIKCNFSMVSFVKKEMKASAKKMVDRLVKKAELLDAGLLHAMMENGRLRTLNPADRTNTLQVGPLSPGPHSPSQRPQSHQSEYNAPPTPMKAYPYSAPPQQTTFPQGSGVQYIPGSSSQAQNQQPIAMELPGDYPGSHQEVKNNRESNNHLHPSNRYSVMSELSGESPTTNDGRWSSNASDYQPTVSSRPTSYMTDVSAMRSPRFEQNGFGPTPETTEEHDAHQAAALKRLEGRSQTTDGFPRYNPQDYA